LAVLQMLKLCA